MGDADNLPHVEIIQATLETQRTERLKILVQRLHEQNEKRLAQFVQQRTDLIKAHQKARASLRLLHMETLLKTTQKAQKNLTKRLRGFWEKLTGQYQRKQELIALEIRQEKDRHGSEMDTLRDAQLKEAKALQAIIEEVSQQFQSEWQGLINSVLFQA